MFLKRWIYTFGPINSEASLWYLNAAAAAEEEKKNILIWNLRELFYPFTMACSFFRWRHFLRYWYNKTISLSSMRSKSIVFIAILVRHETKESSMLSLFKRSKKWWSRSAPKVLLRISWWKIKNEYFRNGWRGMVWKIDDKFFLLVIAVWIYCYDRNCTKRLWRGSHDR